MTQGSSLRDRPHVFVVLGDVTRIECDAWLLPTDDNFHITPPFRGAVGIQSDGNGKLPRFEWGTSSVHHLGRHADGHGPHIWLGRVGRGEGEWSQQLGAVAAEFIEQAGQGARAAAEGRYPVVALPAIGTGHGGVRSHKGELYLALLQTLVRSAEAHRVDVLLVLKHDRAYSAAQRARARLLRRDLDDEESAMWHFGRAENSQRLFDAATELAGKLQAGRLVQFVGAGASAGLWRRAGIPPWQELLDAVAEEAGVHPDALRGLDLRDQATVLAHHLGIQEKSLPRVLTRHLKRSHYTVAHGLLASLGTKEHVTTNFDTMLENALRVVDGDVTVLPYTAVEGHERWVLKLHGSVERQGDEGDPLVITRDDYLAMPLRYGALYGIVQALLFTRHLLFVGYSLRDDDFHQLVHEVRAARGPRHEEKMGTALTLFESPALEILWPDLEIVPMLAAPPPETSSDPSIVEAARRLLVFIDLLGYRGASLHGFLLDPDYAALLPANSDEPENGSDLRLQAALKVLAAAASGEDGTGWGPVHELLADFGANSTDDSATGAVRPA